MVSLKSQRVHVQQKGRYSILAAVAIAVWTLVTHHYPISSCSQSRMSVSVCVVVGGGFYVVCFFPPRAVDQSASSSLWQGTLHHSLYSGSSVAGNGHHVPRQEGELLLCLGVCLCVFLSDYIWLY